jgi:hypothetical protein
VGSGFPARVVVRIRECRAGGGCNLTLLDGATTDAHGRVSRSVTVSERAAGTACGSRGCVISVRRPNGDGAAAAISFA